MRNASAPYRRARTARKRAKRSDRAIHRWRRRSKELGYQLAILDVVPGADAMREALAELDDQLSPVVDHLMTKDYVALYGGGADDTTALLGAVHDRLLAGKDAARKASRDLFKRKPRRLRQEVMSALAADAAVDAPEHHDPGDADDGSLTSRPATVARSVERDGDRAGDRGAVGVERHHGLAELAGPGLPVGFGQLRIVGEHHLHAALGAVAALHVHVDVGRDEDRQRACKPDATGRCDRRGTRGWVLRGSAWSSAGLLS